MRRHFEIVILVAHSQNQQTFVRVARDDDASVLAAPQHRFARVQQQSPFKTLGACAVTFVTAIGQDGANLLLEKLCGFRTGILYRGSAEEVSSRQQKKTDND